MVVLDNPFGLESKKIVDYYFAPPAMIIRLIE